MPASTAAHAASADAGSLRDQAVQAYRRAGIGATAPHQDRTPNTATTETGTALGITREPLALPTFKPAGLGPDGAQELHALVQHVRISDVQHKEALLDLLRVVEEYYRGKASREDATAHWRSFADYVVQYLGDVDGLLAHTDRFGKHMISR